MPIHVRSLGIIADLTTEKFLMTLRRFIARHGTRKEIISDNAAQFKLSKSIVYIVWEKRQKRQNSTVINCRKRKKM